ncbi:MAG: hypothetical protein R3E39_00705 [Anaerolineae bacterium]
MLLHFFQRVAHSFPPKEHKHDDAAATSEPTAALASLQRLSPVFPPANCVSAAVGGELPACQCSGNFAIGSPELFP